MKVEFSHARMPLRARFIASYVFYAVAALCHVLVIRGERPGWLLTAAGLCFFLVPLWFLGVKRFPPASRKKETSGAEVWKPLGMTELDRVRDKIRTIGKVKVPFYFNKSFALFLTFFAIWLALSSQAFFRESRFFPVLDLYLVLFPFLWFAGIQKELPKELQNKLAVFSPLFEAKLPANLRLSAMALLGESEDEAPLDIRLMLAPGPEAPEETRKELLGAQFQLSYNRGPNGQVPYMYAVFITKGTGKIWQSLRRMRYPRYETEADSSEEAGGTYGTVVLRLDTKSRSDGYHTRPRDIEELLNIVISAFGRVL